MDLSKFLDINSAWFPVMLLLVSLFGSAHCLVMCVPILSSQGSQSHSQYHVGRLISYLIVGSLFFYLGQQILLNEIARAVTGIFFLGYFLWITIKEHYSKGCCVKPKPKIKNLFLLGLLNGLLPCGWLFLIFFLLGNMKNYPLFLMYVFIFWIGTVPVFYIFNLKKIVRKFIPFIQNKYFMTSFYLVFAMYSFFLHFAPPQNVADTKPMNFFCSDLKN